MQRSRPPRRFRPPHFIANYRRRKEEGWPDRALHLRSRYRSTVRGLAQKDERTELGFGSAYGAAAWALGDEVAVPALGLGKKPAETPLSQHVQTLAAHVVYGMTLEGVRRLTTRIIGANGRAWTF